MSESNVKFELGVWRVKPEQTEPDQWVFSFSVWSSWKQHHTSIRCHVHHIWQLRFKSSLYLGVGHNCSQRPDLQSQLRLQFPGRAGFPRRLLPALQPHSHLQSAAAASLARAPARGVLQHPAAARAPLAPRCGLQTGLPAGHGFGLCRPLLCCQHSLCVRPAGPGADGLRPDSGPPCSRPAEKAWSVCVSGDSDLSSDLPAACWASWTPQWSTGRGHLFYGSSRGVLRDCQVVLGLFGSLRPPTGTLDQRLHPAVEI